MSIGNGKREPQTPEGGNVSWFINKTGAPSIKGEAVNTEASEDFAVDIVTADEPDIIGFVYDADVADGDWMRVVTSGIADVLLEDSSISTHGYWCRISITQNGRVDMTNAAPSGGTINEINAHLKEVGHCMETKSAGTNVLARMLVHFN